MNIDDRLEALAQSLELLAHMHADAEQRQSAAEERQSAAEERQSAAEERHDREMEDIRREGRAFRSDLRRAFAMGVREARNERKRRQELDEKITQLAAAQLVTEEKLQNLSGTVNAFINSMRNGGNGQPRTQ
jgi:uncharacterized membrane-anchored protein YjiN (DUF445 family)